MVIIVVGLFGFDLFVFVGEIDFLNINIVFVYDIVNDIDGGVWCEVVYDVSWFNEVIGIFD